MLKDYTKLALTIVVVVIVDIVMLSPGLIGVDVTSSNKLESSLGLTILILSAAAVGYVAWGALAKRSPQPEEQKPIKRELKTHEDYVEALKPYTGIPLFTEEVAVSLDQLERLKKKKDTLTNILGQRFDATELSYKKFLSVIIEVEKLLFLNVRGIINKLSVFDPSEFAFLTNQKKDRRSAVMSDNILRGKMEVFQQYASYIRGAIDTSEEILLKLDKLTLEITRLDTLDIADIENMDCMKEIDDLIKQTKFYKQQSI
ncbi:hypothetical protein [Paenibacillus thalictri]|uniref:5-bromo-4-chloroindolyl phosphate hydrolysis protein n=1 Tax=Paenibacillus thalictri TaxID=2527873 RepID=A0A4Q9DSH8_9BACL|nr:hypothetical protein [Paenibacillus thalictri]TBL79847.1 hypothetical protein EYB31_09615 [Paenibacillus thalictri]